MTDTPQLLCLRRCAEPGHALGLRPGDVLIGLDGVPWTGSLSEALAHLAAARRPVALCFRRKEAVWTVLSDRLDLGQWDRVPAPEAPDQVPEGTRLCNWEILARGDGLHDLIALRGSWLALTAPGLWLAQQRLWTWLATLVAGLSVALPAGLPLVAALWLVAGLHLWARGVDHLRADRVAAGFRRAGVIAAPGEAAAIAQWEQLCPGARFRFEGRVPGPAVDLSR